jgi:hypothetical protein
MAVGGLVAPVAAALPPGFPDVGKFSAVDPAPYIYVGQKGGRIIGFTTAQLSCSWELPTEQGEHRSVGCSGEIPGVPEGVPTNSYGLDCDSISMGGPVGSSPLYTFSRGNGPCPPPHGSPRVAVGAKVTAGNVTCAVTDDGVACIDPIVNHGFVLQHPLSWVF